MTEAADRVHEVQAGESPLKELCREGARPECARERRWWWIGWEIPSQSELPRWYGVAWEDVASRHVYALPIPLNLVLGALRWCRWQVKRGWRKNRFDFLEASAVILRRENARLRKELMELQEWKASLEAINDQIDRVVAEADPAAIRFRGDDVERRLDFG